MSSNETFSAWAKIFGDPVAVAAMVDRLVHHAEIAVLWRQLPTEGQGKGGDGVRGSYLRCSIFDRSAFCSIFDRR